ncbi:MAG TPA: di-heme oxidoredictase family protein [Usitatibacter sp.]|nr:di-heme oxidoredictase family protein [Usitatibacter sp.]
MNNRHFVLLGAAGAIAAALLSANDASSQLSVSTTFRARDPGPRGGPAAAGGPIAGLTANELDFFNSGMADFAEAEDFTEGIGPTMNLDSCGGCHAQPAVGGSSPAVNPQVAFAKKAGAHNNVPPFVFPDGPVREARFVKNGDGSSDGGVHALFTVAGRSDGNPACLLAQPDFPGAIRARNVIFRVPTPVFGSGLIEAIPDSAILANAQANAGSKQPLGIRGRANFSVAGRTVSGQTNNNGNDGTVARFGWKAQNKSLLLFSGEAYNVEMGISNELFPTERSELANCQSATVPNDSLNTDAPAPTDAITAISRFAIFQRFLAPPTPSPDTPGGADSIGRGKTYFTAVGCALCHTATMKTGNATVAALRYQDANLYSDLLVHDMGPGLADGVAQGQASGSEFRTAPLWGVGQRLYFLHDGRSGDLLDAINAHQGGTLAAGNASEANGVVRVFNTLTERQKQDILNFLRSL